MTIEEFIKLNFYQASMAFKNVLGNNRIDGYSVKLEEVRDHLKLSDACWGDCIAKARPLVNASIRITNKWSVTKLRIILSIKYNDNLIINYYVGNTGDSCTLKEITYSGIDNYWSGTYSDLSKIGIDPYLTYRIPETPYKNGRKGTIKDFLDTKWALREVNIKMAIKEINEILTNGSFINSWNKYQDTGDPGKAIKPGKLSGYFGQWLIKILTDDTRLSLDQTALLMKVGAKCFTNYITAQTIGYCYFEAGDNFGRISEIKECLNKLEKEIERHRDLDVKMTEIEQLIMVEYDRVLTNFIALNPDINLNMSEIKDMINLKANVKVGYSKLKV